MKETPDPGAMAAATWLAAAAATAAAAALAPQRFAAAMRRAEEQEKLRSRPGLRGVHGVAVSAPLRCVRVGCCCCVCAQASRLTRNPPLSMRRCRRCHPRSTGRRQLNKAS